MYYGNPDQDVIKGLFYQQIRRMTQKSCGNDSFDVQFSDSWI